MNRDGSTLTVLTNTGSGGFVLMATLGAGSYPVSVVAADVNGETEAGSISANDSTTTLYVFINTGSGFALSSFPTVSLGTYWVTAADLNGDGYPELICANPWYDPVTVLYNNGSGGFTSVSAPHTGSEPFFVTPADVNGDGKMDLITANWGNNTVSVLLNDGTGHFRDLFCLDRSRCRAELGNGRGCQRR